MAISRRDKLLSGLNIPLMVGMEIGALASPFVTRADGEIIYIDYAYRDVLVEKYKDDPDIDVDKIVDVNATWGNNTLSEAIGGRKVDYVLASHVIEHVPDMITWLSEIRGVLKEHGQLRLIIPDRRFTFDYLRENTRLSDLMLSYLVRARVPQPHSILDFALNAATVDRNAAWEGKIEPEKLQKFHKFEGALHVTRDVLKNDTYHDVHCWVFTPKGFARLMKELAEVGLLDFACANFYDTERDTIDFFVHLQPSSDRAHIADSWARVMNEAKDFYPANGVTQADPARLPSPQVQEQQQRTIDEMRAQLEAMRASTSWKLTAPLRYLATALRGFDRR